MLDVNLIQGRPPLEIDFRISLAENLLHIMSLVIIAPHYEGFDQWVYATHAALPPDLREDMTVILGLLHKSPPYSAWLHHGKPDASLHQDFSAFIARLGDLPPDRFQGFVEGALSDLAQQEGVEVPTNDKALRSLLLHRFDPENVDRAVHLIRDPKVLQARFLTTLTRFWEQFYREEYRRSLPLMERSVAHHRLERDRADFSTTFTAVTGRLLPDEQEDLGEVERVDFVPSAHIGPYVVFRRVPGPRRTLILIYNCRPSGALEGDQVPTVQDLFPPLKALADETRLQILSILNGRELYAQQIVDRLDISQSAVSRHLQLMVAGGILSVRKEESMKYFAVREETLAMLTEKLARFRGKR